MKGMKKWEGAIPLKWADQARGRLYLIHHYQNKVPKTKPDSKATWLIIFALQGESTVSWREGRIIGWSVLLVSRSFRSKQTFFFLSSFCVDSCLHRKGEVVAAEVHSYCLDFSNNYLKASRASILSRNERSTIGTLINLFNCAKHERKVFDAENFI